jgi:anti-sigma factor (TIGR02949 family)
MSDWHGGKDCARIFERISAYLDRELEPADCDEIRRHITDCPPCVEFLDTLEAEMKLTRGFRVPEKPRPLSRESRERLIAAFRKAKAGPGEDEGQG